MSGSFACCEAIRDGCCRREASGNNNPVTFKNGKILLVTLYFAGIFLCSEEQVNIGGIFIEPLK